MNEFVADKIMAEEKYTDSEPSSEKKGNVYQVRWNVKLDKYDGKLEIEVNYIPCIEIRISFMEVYEKICLRRLEVPLDPNITYNHRNTKSCGNTDIFKGMHKHKFQNKTLDGCAYVPNDIDLKSSTSMIRTFAKECNISINGNIPSVLLQRTLI